jgi:hypothetical protein
VPRQSPVDRPAGLCGTPATLTATFLTSIATALIVTLPGVHWQWPVGAGCAFLLALITTPAGVSGAVLLLPIQLSILHVPSPAVTPTNLLFNVAAVPGGLLRFWHE